jgi:hypothetical protein
MKIATLQRAHHGDDVTLGMLKFQDVEHRPIYTLENPFIDNKPYISCILPDSYVCDKFNGAKFKDVWQLMGVPDRSHILIHHGNTEADTSGCILVGLAAGRLNGQPAVLHSRDAMDLIRDIVGKKSFIIQIKN